MARRSVDVVAAGPPSADPFDPAASAWALAAALAARGDSVQVVHPGADGGATAPAGVVAVPIPAVTAHVGTFRGDAELARQAAHRLRPGADAVVRDPHGFGPIGHHGGGRRIVAFVRELAAEPDGAGADRPRRRLRLPLERLGERGELRRLEREALEEASVVCCASTSLRDRLTRVHGIPGEQSRVLPPAVDGGSPPPERAAARRALAIPDDVPLVAVLSAPGPTREKLLAPAVDGFGRIRRIFPGSRLAVVGVPPPAVTGVVAAPGTDRASLVAAVSAADVGVVVGDGATVVPGLVLALRGGVACVATPGVDVGDATSSALRRADLTDPGEVASVLAELLSDPAERAAFGAAGRKVAERFDPGRLTDELERAGLLGGA